MPTATVAAPEAVWEAFRDLGESLVHRMAVKYSKDRNSPYTSPEDFEQEIWSRFWEWTQDDDHVEQAITLLEDNALACRFLAQFARARICDLIDLALAGPRDQRKTISASAKVGNGVKDRHSVPSLLEHLAHANGYQNPDPCLYVEALDTVRLACRADGDALLLLDTILEQPQPLRESFCESRLRLCRGMAIFTEADSTDSDSVLLLSILEGYHLEDAEITWAGPLAIPNWKCRSLPLTTSQGPALVSRPDPDTAVMRWQETKLTVRLDVTSHEGEFLREVVRPSPKVFDLQAMKDYLGISGLRIRDAWVRLQGVLKAKLEEG
jgi:hypothetical protein